MSLDATRWAWKQKLSPTEKLILLSMADRAGEDHICYPSIKRLVEDTGLNRKTVIANLSKLEQSSKIKDTKKRTGRTKQVKIYRLIGVENRHSNSTENGNIKESQKVNSSKNGTVPVFPLKSPKNGTSKESQKRDTESTSIESIKESTTKRTNALDDRFEEFWQVYPKKKAKGKARESWKKIKPSEQLTDQIIKIVNQAKTSPEWTKENGQYIPYPATWLNSEGWEDDYGPIKNHASAAQRRPMQSIQEANQ